MFHVLLNLHRLYSPTLFVFPSILEFFFLSFFFLFVLFTSLIRRSIFDLDSREDG
jgi:hypothetical protein